MKKLTIVIFLFLSTLSSAQMKKDILNPDVPVVYLGADFSQVRFTKADEFINKPDILKFFVDMNNIIDSKNNTNFICNKLNREEIKKDFSYVTKINESVDWQSVYSDDTEYGLSVEAIENMIKKLNIDRNLYKDFIGFVICQENFSKTKELGTVALVFFNVNELKPLFIKHCSSKPSGFGFFYYWSVINALAINKLKKLDKELTQ